MHDDPHTNRSATFLDRARSRCLAGVRPGPAVPGPGKARRLSRRGARSRPDADPDGARTGVAQKLKELTLTPEVKVSSHLILRSDLRIDWSDVESFEKKDGKSSKTQPTVILNAAYLF